MKSYVIAALVLVGTLVSCNQGKSGGSSTYLPESLGGIHSLNVVIENDLWNGPVGEAIRTHFAAATDGLPQQEPLFTMNQMTPEAYTGFARKGRSFLKVSLSDSTDVSMKENSYARPQLGAFITATTEEGLIQAINDNQAEIIEKFHAAEIKEKQRRIRLSTLDLDTLKNTFGVDFSISSVYRIAQSSEDFFWLRKDLKSGSTNIIVYEVPLELIKHDSTAIGDIIKIRDLIAGDLMPVEDEGRFITEEAYAPFIFHSEIDGRFAYETKGTWEVKDQYMAGPFLNYAVRDEANNRYLILEGFTYAPSVEKRNLQFELEAILKSAKLY